MKENDVIKAGLVAIVGPPNAGKSTLMNALLGQKISIVTPKPQTTRNRILGIMHGDDYQVVLLDTPGLHKARKPLNREMVRAALSSLSEVDLILFMVDVSLPLPAGNQDAVGFLQETSLPTILLLNKVDLLPRQDILPMISTYQKLHPFTEIIPISALNSDGTDRLLAAMLRLLPTGHPLYPEDMPTDATERFIVAEIIREKIFMLTGQEVPYSCAVQIDSFKEDPIRQRTVIHATIFVEKKSQKSIVIGNKGAKLTRIGSDARREIEALLDQPVVLHLWVKVQENWTKNLRFIKELGI